MTLLKAGALCVITGLATAPARSAEPCHGLQGCQVPLGSYQAYLPTAPARQIVLFFHGFGSSGRIELSIEPFRQWAEREQVALLLPDGLDRRWQVVEGATGSRDDAAFAIEVLADARQRWSLGDLPAVASGFSLGGSMVWKLACAGRPEFTGFVALSGAFWEPAAKACKAVGVPVFHFHGTDDEVVPMQGRMVRSGARQAPVEKAFAAMWRGKQCKEPQSWNTVADPPAPLACQRADACQSPGEFMFCQHVEGHSFRLQWLSYALARIPVPSR